MYDDSWGYFEIYHNWKSVKQLIRCLVICVSNKGNFFLNVGSRADGKFPPESFERLEAIGQWMRINEESIYESERCPLRRL